MKNTESLKDYLPELITSLLYASAISAMLSFSMGVNQSDISIIPIINTCLIIFVVFADWNNRILVPLQFPLEDLERQRKPFYQYTKLVSEIISMVFLVMFYSYFIKENYCIDKTINIYSLFALYLVACGIWNLIMIRIMQGINIIPLFKSLIKGNVFDLPDLDNYTKNFKEYVQNKEKKINLKYKENVGDTMKEAKNNYKKYKKNRRPLIVEVNIARTLAQFIGNHISWVNFGVSIMLIVFAFNLTDHFIFIENYFDSLHLPLNFGLLKQIFLIIFLITLIVILLVVELNSVFRKTLFGIVFLGFLLIFYFSFSIDILIYAMIVQQIFIGLSVEFITDNKILTSGAK